MSTLFVDQSRNPSTLVLGEPSVYGVSLARSVQAAHSHLASRLAISHFEQRSSTLAHVRSVIAIACSYKFSPLLVG